MRQRKTEFQKRQEAAGVLGTKKSIDGHSEATRTSLNVSEARRQFEQKYEGVGLLVRAAAEDAEAVLRIVVGVDFCTAQAPPCWCVRVTEVAFAENCVRGSSPISPASLVGQAAEAEAVARAQTHGEASPAEATLTPELFPINRELSRMVKAFTGFMFPKPLDGVEGAADGKACDLRHPQRNL